nr:putative reverse transcriptase domain-containing protein [Tanacetum cinerariifolium]
VPQHYDVSSAMPCLFIHVIYAISLSLYPFTERYAQPYFFLCLIRQVPQDYNASSAVPCLFIHIYCYSLSLYPFTERYAQSYFFSCLIRQVPQDYNASSAVPSVFLFMSYTAGYNGLLYEEGCYIAPRFVGSFEITERIGLVAYRLRFPEELNGSHDTFHVSNLKKCLADPTLQVPLDEIQVDAKLNLIEEPMKILEREFKKLKRNRIATVKREFKKLKRNRIAIVKVRWNSKCGPEFTWEREDQMRLKYSHIFSADSS